jgi:hypothetical protein
MANVAAKRAQFVSPMRSFPPCGPVYAAARAARAALLGRGSRTSPVPGRRSLRAAGARARCALRVAAGCGLREGASGFSLPPNFLRATGSSLGFFVPRARAGSAAAARRHTPRPPVNDRSERPNAWAAGTRRRASRAAGGRRAPGAATASVRKAGSPARASFFLSRFPPSRCWFFPERLFRARHTGPHAN